MRGDIAAQQVPGLRFAPSGLPERPSMTHTSTPPFRTDQVRSLVRPTLFAGFAVIAMFIPLSAAAQDFSHGRRIFLEKADCQYCHGWAGDGAGAGQSPGGAANLRRSQLDREQLIVVIGCGVPGTAMPHFDESAYTDKRCYGMTRADVRKGGLELFDPPATLAPNEVELVTDFLLTRVMGKGPMDHAKCVEFWGGEAEPCAEYKK